MLVGVAILPTAPVLVPGVSPTLPRGAARVCDAVDATVELLVPHDVSVVLAGAMTGRVFRRAEASLAGEGRPDICARPRVDLEVARRIAVATRLPMATEAPLPLDLTVLTLLLGKKRAVVALTVPATASFDTLAATGAAIAHGLADPDRRCVLVAAGDLSAGLGPASPLHVVDGAEDFDARIVEAVDAGRLDQLKCFAPDEAQRVGARGWPALAALHGALAATKLGLVRRHYSAPQGVGYLVAQGA